MSLETAGHISQLNANNPTPADPKSAGDDHLRLIKSALLADLNGFAGAIAVTGVDGGVANAYTVTPPKPIDGYAARMTVIFVPVANNTGASTLNVSAQNVKPLKSVSGDDLVAGELQAGDIYLAIYNGTEFRLHSVTARYVDLVREYAMQLAYGSSLPNQSGNAGKFVTTDGTNGYFDWAQKMATSDRTANAMLVQADRASFIAITSGTFTQTFDTPENLGVGWYVYLRNAGTGDITIPSSDNRTNWIMYPGEVRLFRCTGTGFRSVVMHPFYKVFATSANFIKPPGYRLFGGLLWGGGGSGAKHSTVNFVTGGSGGACSPFTLPESVFGLSELVTIAAGGARVTSGDNYGNPGGDSSIGTLLVSGGGERGNFNPDSNVQPVGGRPYGNISVEPLLKGGVGNARTIYGGPGGGDAAATGSSARLGGTSIFAGAGGDGAVGSETAADGTAPAGAGGGSKNGSSGAGARGELRIWGIA